MRGDFFYCRPSLSREALICELDQAKLGISMKNTFKDNVIIITGGASGIGCALSKELGIRGAKIIICDINKAGAETVASSINDDGGDAEAVMLDVSKEDDFKQLIERVYLEKKRLDMIFNCAGIALIGEICDMEMNHWHTTLDVNLYGTLHGTMHAYKIMLKQGFGHIINFGSTAGFAQFPVEAPFCVSKSAVIALSKALWLEAAEYGVRVSVVCPFAVNTEIFQTFSILNAKREDFQALVKYPLADVTKTALQILKGVSKNKALIVIPPVFGGFVLSIHKYFPFIWNQMIKKALKQFRGIRNVNNLPKN